jgi:hypothetical protein
MSEHVASLARRAQAIEDHALKSMALQIIADMDFTLGEGWKDEFPTLDSRVTQRERHSFSSATAWVEALLGAFGFGIPAQNIAKGAGTKLALALKDQVLLSRRPILSLSLCGECPGRADAALGDLRPDDVVGAVARLHTSKTGKRRDVPLSSAARALWAELPDGWFNLAPAQIDANFRKVRAAAKIEGLTYHDSRHRALTDLAKLVHVLDLARIAGHDNVSQLLTYYNESAADIATRLG